VNAAETHETFYRESGMRYQSASFTPGSLLFGPQGTPIGTTIGRLQTSSARHVMQFERIGPGLEGADDGERSTVDTLQLPRPSGSAERACRYLQPTTARWPRSNLRSRVTTPAR